MVFYGFLGRIEKISNRLFWLYFPVFLHVHQALVFSPFDDVTAATKNVGFEKKVVFAFLDL